MSEIASLREEHQLLRAELRLLEAAIRMGPGTQAIVKGMCWSLACMLDDHIPHEATALSPYEPQIRAFRETRPAHGETEDSLLLRDRHTNLVVGLTMPVSEIGPHPWPLLKALREQMEEEERDLFPLIERLEPEGTPSPAGPGDAGDGIMVIDSRRRIVAMNAALERWTAQRMQEIVGRRECGALFDCRDEEGQRLAERCAEYPGLKALERLTSVPSADYTIRLGTGRRMRIRASYTPLQRHPGAPRLAFVTMQALGLAERRWAAHVPMTIPLTVRRVTEAPQGVWWEGLIRDLSLRGVSLTLRGGATLSHGETLSVSITVPAAWQRVFPFSRVAGSGRVARVEELTQEAEAAGKRVGVAVEFQDDVTRLSSDEANGHAG